MKTRKQIATAIRGLARSTATLRDKIHEVAVDIAEHVITHGDVTLADDLFAAVRGVDRHALAGWLNSYACAKLDPNTGKFRLNKDRRSATTWDAEVAASWPKWYEATKTAEQVAKDLDVAGRIESLAKSIAKASEKDRDVKIDRQAIAGALKNLELAMGEYTNAKLKAKREALAELRDEASEDLAYDEAELVARLRDVA